MPREIGVDKNATVNIKKSTCKLKHNLNFDYQITSCVLEKVQSVKDFCIILNNKYNILRN